jgi:glycerophosphoryl diester phosphodiesterase
VDRIHHFPKIISHRGVCRRHIENTIPALKAAKDENVDMIEMDVHETGDGRFIVVHDARLSPDTPPWRNLTYPQVQAVTGHDDRAPLLSDCLAAIRPVPVNIEIKHFRKADNFSKELEASPISEGSVVSSSHVDLLERLHTGGLGLPMMLVVSISRRRTLKENMTNAAWCIFPGLLPRFLDGAAVHHKLLRKNFVRSLQRRGGRVFVWTVDDRKDMEKFIFWEVDGIISNYPHRLQALKHRSSPSETG